MEGRTIKDISEIKDKCDDFANDDRTMDLLSQIFKVMGDPTRLKIIYALSLSTLNVSELVELVGMSQSSISHQLSLLKNQKLIKSKRVGRNIYYTLDDEHVVLLFKQGYEHAKHKELEND